MVQAFKDAGFETCADLCAVDYLTHPGRSLPDGVKAERFEVVVNLLSLSMRQRVRVRVQVPEQRPVVSTLTDIYPGTDAMEREAYDMVGHHLRGASGPDPDLDARGLGRPPAAQGLRRRPGPGPVQGSAGTPMSEHDETSRTRPVEGGRRRRDSTRSTTSGPRSSPTRASARSGGSATASTRRRWWPRPPRARRSCCPGTAPASSELRREVGAVLRLPEGNFINPADIDIERRDDETMIINMGPQHPSTHGVLRLMLELDGETVLRTKPIIGYLHTGMEKTGEELTYVQGATNVTRMDYLSPLTNELVFSLATEALLGVELPPRAVWIRMLMAELQRVSSHLMWMATNGMDLGSTSMMIYGFREREMVLASSRRRPACG